MLLNGKDFKSEILNIYLAKLQLAFQNQSASFLGVTKAGNHCCKLPSKTTEEDIQKTKNTKLPRIGPPLMRLAWMLQSRLFYEN